MKEDFIETGYKPESNLFKRAPLKAAKNVQEGTVVNYASIRMKTMSKTLSILLFFVLFVCSAGYSYGKSTRGTKAAQAKPATSSSTTAPAYSGGGSDGFDHIQLIQKACLGNQSDLVFKGGSADGHGWGILQQSICAGSYLPSGFLLSWQAQYSNGKVNLEWAFASETNNDYYEIQCSANDTLWQDIVRIPASGKVRQRKEYAYTHHQPLEGISWYRLKMADRDGSLSYSDPVEVGCEKGKAFLLFLHPNPADNSFSLWGWEEKEATLSMYNLMGGKMMQQDLKNPVEEIQPGHLPEGVYLVSVTCGSESVCKKLLIKH
ncbi:MAG TPA: T9SS type A sorting domain-containing protein [Prolixibacteraceae bacterium]|nr:T9SS type A sorting domain-containing protein [Prolixibacteraceae bacterium]